MGGSSQPSTTTQVNKSEPPAYVQPYSQLYLRSGAQLAAQPYQPYTGQRIAPLTPEHYAGLGSITNRALYGSAPVNAANQNITDTLAGRYLDVASNPAWGPTSKAITDAYRTGTAAQTDRAFAQGRALGGSAYNEVTQRNQQALADALSGAAGNLYESERGRQIQAAGLSPMLAAQDYTDYQALLGAGDVYRETEQDYINQQVEDYFNALNYPYQQLDVLGNTIQTASGGYGQTSATGPNPYRSNRTAGALGGAAAGAGLGSQIMPGYGTAIGAVLGGLYGAYG